MEKEGKKENKNNQLKINMPTGAIAVGKIVLIIVIIVVLIAVLIYHITIKNGSFKEEDWSNTGYVVSQKALSNVSTESIAQNENGDWSINIDFDEIIEGDEGIIKTLKENEGVLDHYITKSKQQEYLTAFIKAELITQYPDLRSADKVGTPTEEGEFQGCIQIHRATSDGNTRVLSYVDYDTFINTYIEAGDTKALEHFTLDSNGDIVVAGWTKTITKVESNAPDVENIPNQVDFKLTTKPIPYKQAVEVFSMPFDFLWALTTMSDGEDFPLKVAQLALNSEIIITVHENLSTTVTNTIEKYEIKEEEEQKAYFRVTYDGHINNDTYEESVGPVNTTYTTATTVTSESCSVIADITYADTWFYKYENAYSNEIPEDSGKQIVSPEQPVEDEEVGVQKEEELEVDSSFTANARKALMEYQVEICGGQENFEIAFMEGRISGGFRSWFHKKYTTKLSHTIESKSITTYNKYTQGTPTVTEKVNKELAEEEKENFVSLFIKSRSTKSNILSATDWIFEMLESGPKTADMVDIFKYLLYKATDKDYGVTSLDFKIISLNYFSAVKGSSTENFIKAWENEPLWLYETGQSLTFPTGVLTEDELYYIVYEDGSNGHNNIAYGGATFITDRDNVKVNHPEYGGGYYNHEEYFAEEGIDVRTLYEGALVDKQAATAAFENGILPFFRDNVVEAYLKKYLPEYEFSQAQKDALIAVAYQYGNIYGFADAYKSSLNEDGTINAEKIKENFVVNGKKVFNYEGIANNRKYANCLLFTEGAYIDRSGNEIRTRMSLTNWDGDYYSSDRYTFPVYNQYDSRWASYPFGGPNSLPSVAGNKGKQKTIASSGCGCCSLSAVLSGYLGELITPDILTQKLDEVYPTGSYYLPGGGSKNFYYYDNKLLQKFGCSGKSISSRAEALEALKEGYAVIGSEEGHVLAFAPVSSEDAALGYTFRIIDSARGHNVLCKDFSDADLIVDGNASVKAVIYPPEG